MPTSSRAERNGAGVAGMPSAIPRGQVVTRPVDSALLRGNRLGDPHRRELPVYLPPGYDEQPGRRYPVLFYLAGYSGIGAAQLNWRPWAETLPQRLDRLQAEGRMGPVILALPDCFTRLGGSQYIDSSVCGPYARHLVEELVPLVDASFRTLPGREHRGVLGKSSGGFGAVVHAMLHAETWGAFACHSGDSAFELCFLSDLARSLDEIGRHGSVRAFLDAFFGKPKHSSAETHTVMLLAMAACFDPLPEHPDGFVMPADLQTGRISPERWERWTRWDPARMICKYSESLRKMRAIFIDCGSRDQYHLHFGARQMREELRKLGIAHVYEEFPDNHSDVAYRLDSSLPLLYAALAAEVG
jgi:enterochelin esterase-like enzyme